MPEGVNEAVVDITDAQGELIARVPVTGEGLAEFEWDGQTLEGETAPPGTYTLSASLSYGGESLQTDVLVSGHIESVVVNRGSGAMLMTDTLGSISLNDVYRIQ